MSAERKWVSSEGLWGKYGQDLSDMTLPQLIAYLQEVAADPEYRHHGMEPQYIEPDVCLVHLSGERLETQAEADRREAAEQKANTVEARERAELARLKAKWEGK